MGSKKFLASLDSGAHQKLAALVGSWQGTTRVWFEPDKVADTAAISGTIRSVLEGRFALHEYTSTFMGAPQQGIAIYGYHIDRNRYEAAWIDNGHSGTAIMFSVGQEARVDRPGDLSVLGHYSDGQGGPDWGWRTTIEMPQADRLIITAFNISPAGEEAKAVEIEYTRV